MIIQPSLFIFHVYYEFIILDENLIMIFAIVQRQTSADSRERDWRQQWSEKCGRFFLYLIYSLCDIWFLIISDHMRIYMASL